MIGSNIGPYQVIAKIGEGGMGEVYRARDPRLNREVAIKVLPASVTGDPDRLARFTREAHALAALNHPNIAQIYEAETSADVAYLVMELVQGEDLTAVIARRLPLSESLSIARQIAAALEAAHDAGIVHRDLKPANIKVRPDSTVKVLDFGLAKAMDPASPSSSGDGVTMTSPARTEAGLILGTAAYMSPEQARGKTVDRRADIWAFGAVFYEMLTGRRLFAGKGDTVSDMVAAVLRDDITWSALPSSTPAPIRTLLARCLDRDVSTRLQAIGEARVAIDEAASRAAAPASKPGYLKLGLSLTAVVIVATSAYIFWPRENTAPEPSASSAAQSQTSRSIAVLPFINSSGNPDDDYFADGMTDELIASLGKVPGLRVAARSSAFAFKGQKFEIKDVAQKLGVESVVEGTVRRSGKRLRVTASLINAKDGLQLWSNTFENDGGDAFAVQDDVTRGVVSGLALQFGGAELQASQAGRTKDPAAHDLYKRGLQASNAASEQDLRRALIFFQQAIDRDSKFALAYTALAWVHVFLADAYDPPSEAYVKAKTAAAAALALDDRISDAHALLGYSTYVLDWTDVTAAQREFKRALDLDQNSVNTLNLVGVYRCFDGQTEQGLSDLDRSAKLDPLSPIAPYFVELCQYIAKRYQAVIEAHRKTAAIDPSFAYIDSWVGAAYRELGDYESALREYAIAQKALGEAQPYGLALTYARMGRDKDAREVMRKMDERARTHYVPSISRAMVHANLGDFEQAATLLQHAVDNSETVMLAFRNHTEMAPLLKDPRTRKVWDRVDAMRKR